MWKKRIIALVLLLAGLGIAYFVYATEMNKTDDTKSSRFAFKLGLDLSGGTHLVYRADISNLQPADVSGSLASLRDIIERRVNLFGVSEPVIRLEEPGFTNQGEHRLTVDLPGVTDVQSAIELIGQTPLLEFKLPVPMTDTTVPVGKATVDENGVVTASPITITPPEQTFTSTELTGRYLKHADLVFDPTTSMPIVSITFNADGAKLFEQITSENIGKPVAIFLDGELLSAPTVQEKITGGEAQISGQFTPEEAKQLVARLNSGALPVPIELIGTETVGPTLGKDAVDAGMKAGLIGFLAVALFLILWYRLPGLVAVVALMLYSAITLALFKLIPVTLSAAGIAGFIISIGIAVDANVLIFERVKEEIRNGKDISDAVKAGFSRAWFSIRDSSTSSLITAFILFAFGTSIIKGFALTFGIGVLVSLFSAITVTRYFLASLGVHRSTAVSRFLFSSGFYTGNIKQTPDSN